MKKLLSILIVASTLFLVSCDGEMGPPGAPGQDGDSFLGTVYEIEGDFTSGNDYRMGFQFPANSVYESDVVLVYILWEVVDGLDVWRLLPQTVVLDEGVIQYNFDYTMADVQVFMEFTVPENSLRPAETENQVFRIAVLPADFAALKSVDVSDFNSIMKAPNIELKSFDKIELETISGIEIE